MATKVVTYRAVVEIGGYGSWSHGGYQTRFDALAAARQYITDHPEIANRAKATYEVEHPADSVDSRAIAQCFQCGLKYRTSKKKEHPNQHWFCSIYCTEQHYQVHIGLG